MLERMWRNQTTHTLLLRINNGAVTVQKKLWTFLSKINKPVTSMWPSNYTSRNLSPKMYPSDNENLCSVRNIYIDIFIVMLFVIAPNWTQSWYPSSGEWLNELWYIHTKKYYSAMEKNKLLIHIGWPSTELFWMKNPAPWFHICNIFEITESEKWKRLVISVPQDGKDGK